MGIIVQKFGGTSVANTERLLKVCEHIVKEYNNKKEMVVVVSAQGKTTDNLVKEEAEITKAASSREHDVLLSIGEQITIAKLVLCLNKLGYEAISYTGWQVPIKTNNKYGNADIIDIDTKKIKEQLSKKKIVVVAGFQGINEYGDITTLGRGGSDTTAVALASYLNAEKLIIYTDVDGVYSKDPNKNPDAVKYNQITYDKMIEMAENGAKVLHSKCVKMAKENKVPILVKSTFEDGTGTLVY